MRTIVALFISYVAMRRYASTPSSHSHGRQGPPRSDARNPQHRELVKHLREQHLSGVDTDDDASIALEIEQARIALFASAGVLAFEITQLLSAERLICIYPLYASLLLLLLALVTGWIALVWGEQHRRSRINRRYAIYHQELAGYMSIRAYERPNHAATDVVWKRVLAREQTSRGRLRWLRYSSAALLLLGLVAGVGSAVGTVDARLCCSKLVQPSPKTS